MESPQDRENGYPAQAGADLNPKLNSAIRNVNLNPEAPEAKPTARWLSEALTSHLCTPKP